MFYGRFITHLYADGSAGKSGNGMWDDVIASFKRAGAESTDLMKLFVAIVYIPELQFKYGYFYLWGAMLIVFFGLLWYFKRKKWL